MPRPTPNHSARRQPARKRSSWGPVIATAAATLAVFGVLGFVLHQSPAPSESAARTTAAQTSAATPVAATSVTHAPEKMNLAQAPAASRQVAKVKHADPQIGTVATVRVAAKPAAPNNNGPLTAADRAKLVRDQIAAGEFGPALQTAKSATNAVERTQLLKTIADAQVQNGDLQAADMAISRIPIPESRDQARAQNSSRQSAAGGAAQAAMLVNLIKNTTGDQDDWQDEEGQRKQPIYWPPGIEVDPNGLLRGLTHQETGTVLASLGHRAREADLNTDLRATSSLRLVSLTRLEKEVSKRLAEGRTIPETMQHLAGLSQIRYVFVYPDQHDVVIGGPAQGWRYNEKGIAVGRESGKAALFLDDLVTVLRTFAPHGPGYFNCQIVPREEGLRRIKQFVEESNARGPLEPAAVRNWTNQLQQQLGLQDVEINGIPDDSRVAEVIFEADYRLKMIGIGKLAGVPGIPSVFELLPKTGEVKSRRMDALRWWLSMKYDAVMHSPDRNVFENPGGGRPLSVRERKDLGHADSGCTPASPRRRTASSRPTLPTTIPNWPLRTPSLPTCRTFSICPWWRPCWPTTACLTGWVGTWVPSRRKGRTTRPIISRPRPSCRWSTTAFTTAKTSWCRWRAASTARFAKC